MSCGSAGSSPRAQGAAGAARRVGGDSRSGGEHGFPNSVGVWDLQSTNSRDPASLLLKRFAKMRVFYTQEVS